MSETAEILRRARKRIEDPERWTRGAYARDAQGNPAGGGEDGGDAFAPDAVCWCVAGAIEKEGRPHAKEAIDVLARAIDGTVDALLGVGIVPALNDGRTFEPEDRPRPAPARHRKVLAALDRAIELAEAKP